MKHCIYLLALALPCLTNAQSHSGDSSIPLWKKFNKISYSIDYPETWSADTSRMLGSDVIFYSPKEAETDKFSENVNVMVQDLTGMGINLDRYVEISEKQIKTLVTNGNLIESKRLSNGGLEFHQLIYTGSQGIYNLKTLQYYIIESEKAFIVTLVTEADKYEKFEDTGRKILNAFRLTR